MRPDASTCICLTPPTDEPVTLAEVKEHLRVDGTDEDALLGRIITAARERIEHEIRRALQYQKWVAYIKGCETGLPVELPRPRLVIADAMPLLLEYRDTAGVWHESTDRNYQEFREPALLWITDQPSGIDSPRSPEDAVWRVTYWCGYGATAGTVPGPIKQAIMLLVAHLFDRRDLVESGSKTYEVPKSLDWLIDCYRVPWGGVIK